MPVDITARFNSPFTGTAGGNTLGDLMGIIATASASVAGLIVLFLFIFAGYSIIAGAGSGNSEQTSQGKKAATYAIAGFLIIILAWWALILIEVLTGVSYFTSPNI